MSELTSAPRPPRPLGSEQPSGVGCCYECHSEGHCGWGRGAAPSQLRSGGAGMAQRSLDAAATWPLCVRRARWNTNMKLADYADLHKSLHFHIFEVSVEKKTQVLNISLAPDWWHLIWNAQQNSFYVNCAQTEYKMIPFCLYRADLKRVATYNQTRNINLLKYNYMHI